MQPTRGSGLLWAILVAGMSASASCRYGYDERREGLTLDGEVITAGAEATLGGSAAGGSEGGLGSSMGGGSGNAGPTGGTEVGGNGAGAGAAAGGTSALGQVGDGGAAGNNGGANSGGDASATPAPPPCSVSLSNKKATILFDNQTADRTYRIDWIGYDCAPTTYIDMLVPGQQWGLTTYAGHTWLAVDLGGGPSSWVVVPSGTSTFTYVLR